MLYRQFFAVLVALVQVTAYGWDISGEEKQALASGTLRYSIDRPCHLFLEMIHGYERDCRKLEIVALKTPDGKPGLPYRIKIYGDAEAREIVVFSENCCSWESSAEKLLVCQDPILDLFHVANVGDEAKAARDGLIHLQERGGRCQAWLRSTRSNDAYELFEAGAVNAEVVSERGGASQWQRWSTFDGGLRLTRWRTDTMRSKNTRDQYRCAWAFYEKSDSDKGWITTEKGDVCPFLLKVRVWKDKGEMDRNAALCIARVSGEASTNSVEDLKIASERGGEAFCAMIKAGVLGEFSRRLYIRYDDAETYVSFGARLSSEALKRREQEFKSKYRVRLATEK